MRHVRARSLISLLAAASLSAGSVAALAQTAAEGRSSTVSARSLGVVVTLPSGPAVSDAAAIAPPNRTLATPSFAYPADGSAVLTGPISLVASTSDSPAGPAARATSVVASLSLFGGEVTAVALAARAGSAAQRSGATSDGGGSSIASLAVLGQVVPAPPGARIELGDWGYALVLTRSAKTDAPPGGQGSRGSVVALDVYLTADHGGLPAGARIQIGVVESAARLTAAPPPATRPATTIPAPRPATTAPARVTTAPPPPAPPAPVTTAPETPPAPTTPPPAPPPVREPAAPALLPIQRPARTDPPRRSAPPPRRPAPPASAAPTVTRPAPEAKATAAKAQRRSAPRPRTSGRSQPKATEAGPERTAKRGPEPGRPAPTTPPEAPTPSSVEPEAVAPPIAARPPQDLQPALTAGRYAFPVYGEVSFTDTFGALRAAVGWHHGEDLFAQLGTPLLAVADGTVFSVGWNDVGGNRLWLRDRQGNQFYYAHLSAFSTLAVNGRRVEAGEVIGFMGRTGDAEGTPYHLHFEVHPVSLLFMGYDGAVNPNAYLRRWERVEEIDFVPVAGLAQPAVGGAVRAPQPGAVLLSASDISIASGLEPGSLQRAYRARGRGSDGSAAAFAAAER